MGTIPSKPSIDFKYKGLTLPGANSWSSRQSKSVAREGLSENTREYRLPFGTGKDATTDCRAGTSIGTRIDSSHGRQ